MDYSKFWTQYYLVRGGIWAIQNPQWVFGGGLALAAAFKSPRTAQIIIWEITKFEGGQLFNRISFYLYRLPKAALAPKPPPAAIPITARISTVAIGGIGFFAVGVGAAAIAAAPTMTTEALKSDDRISNDGQTYMTPQWFLDGFA